MAVGGWRVRNGCVSPGDYTHAMQGVRSETWRRRSTLEETGHAKIACSFQKDYSFRKILGTRGFDSGLVFLFSTRLIKFTL